MIQLAGAVIVDPHGRLLLIHRNDARLREWQIPGGKIEAGESAAEAAVRELNEELAIEVEITRSLGTASFIDPTIDRAFHYEWFLAALDQGEPTIQEPEKFDAWRFVAWPAVEDLDAISPNVVNFVARYPNLESLRAAPVAGMIVQDNKPGL